MQLTVQELMVLATLKGNAESALKFQKPDGHQFSVEEYTVLAKVLEGFSSSQIKVRLRKPKRLTQPKI